MSLSPVPTKTLSLREHKIDLHPNKSLPSASAFGPKMHVTLAASVHSINRPSPNKNDTQPKTAPFAPVLSNSPTNHANASASHHPSPSQIPRPETITAAKGK